MKIGIRCDCGIEMGMGHIARQELIYKELKRFDYEVFFFMEKGKNLIKSWNLPLLEMSLIKEMDCLIIDLLTNFEHFDFPKRKMVFYDGPERIKCDADIIFAPNYLQKKSYYNERYFTGFDYIPMEPGLLKIGEKRVISDLKDILIMTSGVDLWDMPKKILSFIRETNYKKFVRVSNTYPNECIHYLKKDAEIVPRMNNVSNLYDSYDLMICTAGNVLFEAAVAGLPCISFSASNIQEGFSTYLDKKGFSIHLGGFWNGTARVEELPTTLRYLSSISERKKRSKKGKRICDGKGLHRIVNIIRGEFI